MVRARPARLRALVDELWTDDVGYLVPIVAAEGRDATEDVVATAQRQFPVVIGLVVMVYERTRLRRVHGFLDPVPAHIPSPGAGS
ncbi:hypothetical protein BU52_07620 [Streptomyces toyocaensis]|uniref:Uncharacterized protein n=1 Tax=Streptomyces toyocaensis TaxID=55952 RepID=A0A081XW62_STRTO|nr:hypothetical protein [Streptomyces toyocaensis]KES07785.1 hypothetical protein BU52_07620 [Streptomyces toyocaensis]